MRIFIALAFMLTSCKGDKGLETTHTVERMNLPKGKLFIIGGGSRPMEMIEELVRISMDEDGYALVMTQSSSEPDTSFFYINEQLIKFTDRPIIHLDSFRLANVTIDSILGADMIYITGGDQNRFLEKVAEEKRNAINEAYYNGTTVAGTSAGAALMSEVMITGDQRLEENYEPTFSHLRYENGIYQEGLGLLDSVILDQHFVARSRYNRLLSALADTKYPLAAGVEEATALVVYPEFSTVVGKGQVIVFERAQNYTESAGRIGFRNLIMNAYLEGDTFKLKYR